MKFISSMAGALWKHWQGYVLDEQPNDPDKAIFKARWDACKTADNTETEAEEARDWILRRLEHDFEERRGSLRSASQEAGVTANVLALLLVGLGLVLQNKLNIFDSVRGKTTAWLVAIAIITLTNSYMPRFFKAWTAPFEGAGEYASNASSKYGYAELLRQDLQIRNRIAQRAKRRMSTAKVLLGLVVLLVSFFITLG